jgi:Transglycosylase-like domain
MFITSTIQPAAAVTAVFDADVAAFSSRAQQWTEARQARREVAQDQALALAADARQAEQHRLADAEAARVEEAARLRAAEIAAQTTTVPPTTAPPTTVAPTTVAPTTVAPTTDSTTSPTTVPPPIDSTTAPTTVAPTTTVAPPAASAGPTAAQWVVLRQCESSGNYTIVSSNGRYRGAYQFSQATWDWIASSASPSLVGVDPIAATPAEQDAMALALWNRRGWTPWPICGAAAAAA